MESQLAFLDCPAWLDDEYLARCGLPAEVLRRFIIESTSGPLESVMIKCPARHSFIAPVGFLSLERHRDRTGAQDRVLELITGLAA